MYFQIVFFLFYDSQVHEEHSGIFMLGNNYFIRKRCWYITFTCQWVDIVHSVWVTLTDPSSGQIYYSIVSFDALLCPFSYEAAYVGFLSAIVYLFFFLLFFLFQRKYTFILFHLDLSISVFLFFINYCCPWSCYKSFSYFQFSSWITICHFFSIQYLFIWFLIFFSWFFC